MNADDYDKYRQAQFKNGLLFQDFVVDVCWNLLKLAVCTYSSKIYQQRFGESLNGAEIKYDMKFKDTGNLYIELREKARPRPGDYAESGINRDDNTWLYIIGDYDTIFIFPKSFLKLLAASGKYRITPNKTSTSEGMLLPLKDAERYAAQILYPKAKKRVGNEIMDLAAAGRDLYKTLSSDASQMLMFGQSNDSR